MRPGAVNWQKLWPIVAALPILLNGCGSNKTVFQEVFEQVYPVEPNTKISIQNIDGAVLVYGAESNEIRVQSVKKAYSRKILSHIAIDVSVKRDTVSVTTRFPVQPQWAFSDRSGTVDYTIVVPASVTVSALDLNAGEVFLNAVRGQELRARLNDGRILARNCFTNLDLTMTRGTLTLAYDWWEQEKFSAHVNVGQGNASVFLPSDAGFHLLAHAAHGKIANDFSNILVSTNPSAKGMTIDQIVNGGGQATIEIQVDKGNIKVGEANP